MNSTLRRFEILLPLQFNDGRNIPPDLLADAVLEVVDQFGAVSYYDNLIEGRWTDRGIVYRDNNSKLVVDVEDNDINRQWMRDYKARWKEKLEQLELWLVSYEIDVE
ncbi:MAG TPA: hypothetical protein VK612_05530 [Pyrinomonadaceae bacterium]|nr:hypothetical protein [Pyrinomonadaceae bacterium]